MTDTMPLACDERADLADFLATLTPAQWDAPTLCAKWRVRDVVAHVYSYDDLGFGGLVRRLVTSGPLLGRLNAAGVAAAADRSPDELVALARTHVRPKGLTAGLGGRIALTDGMIHHQDIRRPLGLHRQIPADRLVATLAFARIAPAISAPLRVRGLTLVATDVDWRAGRGPAVEGPGEALLMAIAGRRGVVDELSGPGVPTLAARIGG